MYIDFCFLSFMIFINVAYSYLLYASTNTVHIFFPFFCNETAK